MLEARSFNVKLQNRIRELGFKNYQAAFACKMHETDFSRIINGHKALDEKRKKLICEFLNSSPECLGL